MNLQAQLNDYLFRMKMEQAARNQAWQDLKRISLPPEPKPLTEAQRQEWRNEQFKAIRHLHTPMPLSAKQRAILDQSRRLLAEKPPERSKIVTARKKHEWEIEKAKAKKNLAGYVPAEQREQREQQRRNRTMSSDTKRRGLGGAPPLSAAAINSAIRQSIDIEHAAIAELIDQKLEERAEIHAKAFGEAVNQLLDDERAVITQILDENRKDDRRELADEVRELKIELAQLEASIGELRAVVASERARVIDEKYNANRRNDMN